MTRIAMLQGHPDAASDHLCHALAAAYEKGASEAGHEVRKLDIARMEYQFLRTQTEFLSAPQSRDIQDVRHCDAVGPSYPRDLLLLTIRRRYWTVLGDLKISTALYTRFDGRRSEH
jgi:hypothetical protein